MRKINPKSLENLKHYDSKTGSIAGKKGAEARTKKAEERKKMAEVLDILLKKARRKGDVTNPEDIKNIADADGLNIDMQTSILMAAIERANMGDIQAMQFIRDTVGEKPGEKVEIDQSKTIEAWAKTHEIEL